jgi:hypothetical protein
MNSKFRNRTKSEYRTIDRLKLKHSNGLKEDGDFCTSLDESLFLESPRKAASTNNNFNHLLIISPLNCHFVLDKKGCLGEIGSGGTSHQRKSESELLAQFSGSVLFKSCVALSPVKEPRGEL